MAILEFDAITEVKISSAPAALVELCFVPISQDATVGWELLPDFPYPLCLPVSHSDYPCPGKPVTQPQADNLAVNRVLYGNRNIWRGEPFHDLHEQLKVLVEGGPPPSGMPMAERSTENIGEEPTLKALRPLDLVLLSSLHPVIGQILGLYWVDRNIYPNKAYDYILVEDNTGLFGGNPAKALSEILQNGIKDFEGYIVFNKKMAPSAPLSVPDDLRAYVLPGIVRPAKNGELQDANNNAGFRWERGITEDGVLLPDKPFMYHLWRAELGEEKPEDVPSSDEYQPITKGQPILVTRPRLPSDKEHQRPPNWPPLSMHAIDNGLQDGWYSYKVSGIDLFGRHSPNSEPAKWYL